MIELWSQAINSIAEIGPIYALVFVLKLFLFVALTNSEVKVNNKWEESMNPYDKFSKVGATLIVILYLDLYIIIGIVSLIFYILVFIFHKREPKKIIEEKKNDMYDYDRGIY